MSVEAFDETGRAGDARREDEARRGSWFPEFASGGELMKAAKPSGVAREGYYGLPMLKRPLWKWEIAFYFFFEGVSAGSFLLGTLAEFTGEQSYAGLTRAARYLSLATLLPCPPLLIADLGRPERFHHMLRVWRPKSPMNLGAWALSGFSLPVGLLAVKQLTGDVAGVPAPLERAGEALPARVLGALGIPFALVMMSYPGVLLSTTSTPVWSRTRFLGALIACSSMSTAAAALSLSLSLRGEGESHARALARLEKIERVAAVCEGAALAAYLKTSGQSAEPLVKGRYAPHLWLGAVAGGLLVPALLRGLYARREKEEPSTKRLRQERAVERENGMRQLRGGRQERVVRQQEARRQERGKRRGSTIIASALTLAGGLALKWALTHAGRVSAESAEAARHATKARA